MLISTGRPCSVAICFQIAEVVTVFVIGQEAEYGEVGTQSNLILTDLRVAAAFVAFAFRDTLRPIDELVYFTDASTVKVKTASAGMVGTASLLAISNPGGLGRCSAWREVEMLFGAGNWSA